KPFAHRDDGLQPLYRFDLLIKQVACPLIAGEIIIYPAVCGCTDPQLLGATAPVQYVMATAQRSEAAFVIYIHFSRMPAHRFGKPKCIVAPCTQKIIPKPKVGGQLGIIRPISPHGVSPGMSIWIRGMHGDTEIPESIAPPLF